MAERFDPARHGQSQQRQAEGFHGVR
jgi:hypothetical protein